VVDVAGEGVEVVLVGDREVGALSEPAADEAVEVLVDGPLPGRVRIGEVDGDASGVFEVGSSRHLPALIPGQGVVVGVGQPGEQLRQAVHHGAGVVAVGELAEQGEAGGSVDQGDDRGPALGADDEVAFEVADLLACCGWFWAGGDGPECPQRRTPGGVLAVATPAPASVSVMEVVVQPAGQPPAACRGR